MRDTMLYGESGLLTIASSDFRPRHIESKRQLLWPNGVIGITLSAEEPDSFRGPQYHYAWADELAAWQYPEAWDQLRFGLRLRPDNGTPPRAIVTTTPRPTKIIKGLLKEPGTRVTRGSTYDNAANLAPAFLDAIKIKYEGTRLGRQELFAEILEDNPGALWKRVDIDKARLTRLPDLKRVVVAIDPAVTSTETSDETGIVVAGIDDRGDGYVIEDASGKYSPDEWARKAVYLFEKHHADRIIAEVNNGGDLVESTIRTVAPRISYRSVHASRGKAIRAEPIAALYEQGRVHHMGALDLLEDQLCVWDPTTSKKSPDRLDALVWALTELMVKQSRPTEVSTFTLRR